MLETIPPDHTGINPDRRTREVDVEAATYEQAREQLTADLPEGWRIVWVRED